MNSTSPLVSVVIPAFNAARTVAQTLDSVRAQTYRNIEIIVVNDGSTDGTAEILRSYGESVRVVDQPNSGLAKARNTGCQLARGEFIALMDADDLCTAERIALQVAVMQSVSEAVLCSSDFAAFSKEGLVTSSHGAKYYSMISDAADGLNSLYPQRRTIEITANTQPASIAVDVHFGKVYGELVHGNFVHPPTVLFRRRALETAGMFDETLRYTCDWEWMVRMARSGSFAHINRSLLEYRLSETQMSSHSPNGAGAVDIVRAATKIWRADPELMAADRVRMRKSLGEFCLDAAYSLAERKKLDAIKMLFRSVWTYGVLKPATLKIAVKILLPFKLLQFAQGLRAHQAG
ncbi:MAG: glycosyltransferase [Gammaproteobacteria bacterium]|nr:glycosyltransferase [Gammaproteobacteria bacterium]